MSLVRRAYMGPHVSSTWNLFRDFDEVLKGFNQDMEPTQMKAFTPQAEVKETDKGYLLSFDIPGMKEDEIKIEFSDSVLRIFGERKSESQNEVDGYFETEKIYGRFERQFRLPESVNDSDVEAHYENGVLQVFLPKSPAKVAKKIEIKKGEASFIKKLFSKNEDQH